MSKLTNKFYRFVGRMVVANIAVVAFRAFIEEILRYYGVEVTVDETVVKRTKESVNGGKTVGFKSSVK